MMVLHEWNNNGPQDLATVPLYIQNAIMKNAPVVRNIHLPIPSPSPPPQSTILPSENLQCHLCQMHALYNENQDEKTSSKCQTSLNEIYNDDWSQVSVPLRRTRIQRSWDDFWWFVQKCFRYSHRLLQELSRWRVSGNLEDAGWMSCQILWNAVGKDLRKINTYLIYRQRLWWASLQSACQLHTPSKSMISEALCSVRWMDYPSKGEVLTNRFRQKLRSIWEKWAFSVHRKYLRFIIAVHEKNGSGNKNVVFIFISQTLITYM